jgi:hypothetical protein
MMNARLHTRLVWPNVTVDSPLIDCQLVDLSTSGLGFETSIGLRLGVPYPFRLRDGTQTLGTEAVVRWCRLVRNETVGGESRPVYRAGAAFVEWQTLEPPASAGEPASPDSESPTTDSEPAAPDSDLEQQIDSTLDDWLKNSQAPVPNPEAERKIIHNAPQRSPR